MKAASAAAGFVWTASILGVSVLGCPGTLAEKECFLQARDAESILLASCTSKSCHSAEDMALDLDLETPGLGKRLPGQTTTLCDDKPLLVPGDPDASVLYGKLLDTPPCGSRMPLGQPALYPEDIETIRVWIAGLDGSCATGNPTGGAGGTGGGAGGTGGSGGAGGGAGGTGGSGGASGGSGGTGGTAGSM